MSDSLWQPTPISDYAISGDLNVIDAVGPDGHVRGEYEAKNLRWASYIPAFTDPDRLAIAVTREIQQVSERLTSYLNGSGRIADQDEYAMTIIIETVVKTWPAIPGITVPPVESMPGDAS